MNNVAYNSFAHDRKEMHVNILTDKRVALVFNSRADTKFRIAAANEKNFHLLRALSIKIIHNAVSIYFFLIEFFRNILIGVIKLFKIFF